MKDLPLLAILKIITTSYNFTQKKKHPTNKRIKLTKECDTRQVMYFMYGFVKILEYSTKMNRLRRETCTLPEHNLPRREREREKKLSWNKQHFGMR